MTARPSCFRLLTHCERRAASRAACTAGNKRAIRTAMMAMTTSSSIRVKPRRFIRFLLRVQQGTNYGRGRTPPYGGGGGTKQGGPGVRPGAGSLGVAPLRYQAEVPAGLRRPASDAPPRSGGTG